MEKLYREECLKHCELCLFNDSIVADYAYHKGTSSSKTLFNLILRLRNLQMTGDFILHLIHISGDRMIDCGVDTLSRRCLTEEVMRVDPILSFLPLHLSTEEKSEGVVLWLRSFWASEEALLYLQPYDWFLKTFSYGNFI